MDARVLLLLPPCSIKLQYCSPVALLIEVSWSYKTLNDIKGTPMHNGTSGIYADWAFNLKDQAFPGLRLLEVAHF